MHRRENERKKEKKKDAVNGECSKIAHSFKHLEYDREKKGIPSYIGYTHYKYLLE